MKTVHVSPITIIDDFVSAYAANRKKNATKVLGFSEVALTYPDPETLADAIHRHTQRKFDRDLPTDSLKHWYKRMYHVCAHLLHHEKLNENA